MVAIFSSACPIRRPQWACSVSQTVKVKRNAPQTTMCKSPTPPENEFLILEEQLMRMTSATMRKLSNLCRQCI